MFVKMSFSAILGLFTLGACGLPFILDFWGPAPPSILTETLEPELNLEGAIDSSTSELPSPASDRLVFPTPTLILTEIGNGDDLTIESEYIPQMGAPVWLPNFAHSELGCNWLGVAGQVLNQDNHPANHLIIEVGGFLDGTEVLGIGLTGLAADYGTGGYEIVLSDHVVDSSQTMWIQIHDITGNDLSNRIFFDTFDDCGRNLILINFIQAKSILNEFLPLLNNQP